jgi:hypothetical protein
VDKEYLTEEGFTKILVDLSFYFTGKIVKELKLENVLNYSPLV